MSFDLRATELIATDRNASKAQQTIVDFELHL